MALQPFDAELHHVGLGVDEADLDGYMLLPGYQRNGQQSGTPADFGGTADLVSSPSLSRWTMDDFSGGVGRFSWGRDAAAFADSLNVAPSKFEPTLRTVPPVVLFASHNVAGEVPMYTCATAGFLFSVFKDRVERWDAVTGARTNPITGYGTTGANTIRAATLDRNSQILLLLTDSGVIQRHALPGGALQSSWAAPSSIVPSGARGEGINLTGSDCLFACSGYLYKLTLPQGAAPASSDWLKLGRLPGLWTASAISNGIFYFLLSSSDSAAVLVQWAGASGVLPVTEFPYNFTPESMEVYAGRIYVGGAGRDFSDTPRFGMLFEVTGASVRLVRVFRPEGGAVSTTLKSLHHLATYEGLLVMGDTGRCIESYDITTDAFYGGSELLPPDGVRQFRRLLPYRDTIFTWITHPLDQNQDGWYKVITPADGPTAATNPFEGIVITSDFAVEPDRKKRWSVFRVLTRYGPCGLGYSTAGGAPGGDTFIEIDDVSTNVQRDGDLYVTTFDLSEVEPTEGIRFRIRMPRGQNAAGFTELVAFTASFLFLDTGKWAWSIQINGTEMVESRASTKIRQDVSDIGTRLRSYWKDRVPVVFRDVDGVSYRVQVAGYRESQPIIGPRSDFTDPNTLATDSAQEAFHTLTLIEV